MPFTAEHGLIVVACASLTFSACVVGHHLHGHGRGRAMDITLGCLGIAHWLAYLLFALTREDKPWQYAIPLQMCDLVGLTAPLAWIVRSRTLSILTYFFGIGLSSQAFLTPVVERGPGSGEFWFFFGAHTFIVGGAAYEVFARNLRITGRDLRMAILVGVVYVVLMIIVNAVFQTNFAYVGKSSGGRATIADALGPWPLRILWICLLATGMLLVAYAPWYAAQRLTARR